MTNPWSHRLSQCAVWMFQLSRNTLKLVANWKPNKHRRQVKKHPAGHLQPAVHNQSQSITTVNIQSEPMRFCALISNSFKATSVLFLGGSERWSVNIWNYENVAPTTTTSWCIAALNAAPRANFPGYLCYLCVQQASKGALSWMPSWNIWMIHCFLWTWSLWS